MNTKKEILNPGDPRNTALLIIDVQQGLFEKNTPIYQTEKLIENILNLIHRAHETKAPVVFIQHCDHRSLIKGTASWQLHPSLIPLSEDWQVIKEHGNAFEETNLCEMLKSHGIGRIVVCGLVTHGCIKSTCFGGLEEGFQVTLAGNAHSSFSGDAVAMIIKWNKALAEIGVIVNDSAEIRFD